MAEYSVHPAQLSEVGAIARIKADYVRSTYRGFLSPEYLRQIGEDYYVPQIRDWLSGGLYSVDVLDVDGRPTGFIVYGHDPDAPGCGLIYEQAIDPVCGMPEKNTLVHRALAALADMGLREIHLWALRDNFRLRFLYESLGFRADGMVREDQLDSMELRLARYTYIIPENA
ncbi:MAG: GNAT family N-acetyltransferase [Clostridia bacterium]|nr:GNAT family N-acetyltransferase [Clostridia bacterium]